MTVPKFAERMATLAVTDQTLATVIDRDPADVTAWREGKAKPDDDSLYLLEKALNGSWAAELALDRANKLRKLDMRGDGMRVAGIDPPTPPAPIRTGGIL